MSTTVSVPEQKVTLAQLREVLAPANLAAVQDVVGSEFLPYIALGQGQSELVQKGELQLGHFALIQGKNVIPLGSEFCAIVLDVRPCAIQFTPEMIVSYDTNSDLFRSIKERSSLPDSGCGYGPQFLVYLPDYNRFATYGFLSASARNEAVNIMSEMATGNGTAVVMQHSERVTSKKNGKSWFVQVTRPCARTDFQIPLEETHMLIEKFRNPTSTDAEVADTKTETTR